MTTEIAVLSQAELDLLNSLASEMGASAEDLTGGGTFLPSLKVWMEDDSEEDGAPRLKGKLYVTGQDPIVYVDPKNPPKFRALTQTFQFRHWDKESETIVNKTRLLYSFKEEARDEKGTIRCGKPPSKDLRDNKALQKQYEDIKTFRILQGFISYVGKTADGQEVEVKDLLISIQAKGASFNAFDEEVVKQMPDKFNLWDFESTISTTREKQGTVTYWVMHYEPDFNNKLPMTLPVLNTISDLKNKIDDTNRAIDKKYYDAINNKNGDDDAIAALKTVGGGRPGKFSNLDDDLSDAIPF